MRELLALRQRGITSPAASTSAPSETPDLAALSAALGDLPLAWIEASLAATDARSVNGANDLALVRSRPDDPPLRSNVISAARERLGEAPLADLAARTAREWAHPTADAQRWRGLAVYGLDGSTLRVADTPDNRAHFGGQGAGPSRGTSGYPLARVVALMGLRSHLLAALALGSYAETSELSLTPALLAQVPDDALTILDRNFLSARLLLQYARAGAGRHWLLRAKSTTRWRRGEQFVPGDELVEMDVSGDARRRDPTMPRTWRARAIRYHRRGFRPQVLLTSLLDPARWPARELVERYHERWECELGFDEIKTEQLDRREMLRSRSPEGVRQEIWGLMIGYNLVRRRAVSCAAAPRVPPLRVSFVRMLRQLRDRWIVLAIAGVEVAARLEAHQNRQGRRAVLPPRRENRQYPRAVKLKMSNYARKRPVARAA